MKIKEYSPVFCPKGCGVALQAIIIKNLSSERWNNHASNLKVLDKFTIKRIK